MKQQTSISMDPAPMTSTLCPTLIRRDVPMTMPRRRASRTSLTSLVKSHQQLLSSSSKPSTCPVLYSPTSSMHCLDNCNTDILLSNNSFHLTEQTSDESAAVLAVATVGDDKQGGVRFVPSSKNAIVTCMGLCDYTPDEVEACWYSRDDIKSMRHKRKRRLYIGRDPRCPLLKREDKRWSAEPTQ